MGSTSFSRELEHERAAAARDLELFKADLLLPAEVRRQVAIRKVAAVQEVITLGEPLIRRVLNARGIDNEDFAEAMMHLNSYSAKVRELAYYFDEPVAKRLYGYASKLLDAKTKMETKHDPNAFQDAGAAYEELLAVVRQELGISSAGASPAPRQGSGG